MKEFIEKLKAVITEVNEGVCHYCGCDLNSEAVTDTIDHVADEYKGGWIPCSERLPETIDDMLQCVIVTNENDWQGMAYYHPQKGWTFAECHNSDKKIDWTEIIAWQPLPQPYKPQKLEWKDKVMKHFTNVE